MTAIRPPQARPRAVPLQFGAAALVWGASFLFIKIALEAMTPVQVVLGRLVCGAVALLVVCAVSRQRLPTEPTVVLHLAVVAVLACVAPFLLFAWAELQISSGLASIYNATTPLMTTLVALVALSDERLTRLRAAGLLLGLLGVLIVLGPWRGLGEAPLFPQLACLLATACYGAVFVYLRRFVTPRGLPVLPVVALQISMAAVMVLAVAPFTARTAVDWTPRVALSIVVLGVLGTGLAYVWNLNVVNGWGATAASTVTYLTPLVGVVLGVLVLAERPTWNEPVGALLVVLGILVSRGLLAPRRPG